MSKHTREKMSEEKEEVSKPLEQEEEEDASKTLAKGPSFRIKEKNGGLARPKSEHKMAKKVAIPPESDHDKRFTGTWESESHEGLDTFLAEL